MAVPEHRVKLEAEYNAARARDPGFEPVDPEQFNEAWMRIAESEAAARDNGTDLLLSEAHQIVSETYGGRVSPGDMAALGFIA